MPDMTWNYRIVKYADGSGFGVHEVYYDEGREFSMTENPASFAGDTAEEVLSELNWAHVDACKWPIFDEPEDWSSFRCQSDGTNERANG